MLYVGAPLSMRMQVTHPDTSISLQLELEKYGDGVHSIALAAIFARFLISADKIFASTGAITNITWEEDYRTYRKLLASNRNTPLVKHIFKTVNAHVFAGVSKTAGTAEKEVEDVEDEISDAMHRLAFGNFDDPPQSDNDAVIPSDHSNGPARPLAVETQQPAAGPSLHTRFSDAPPQVHEIPSREGQEVESLRRSGRGKDGRCRKR
ncbi:hypothetical protein B0H13DRAFT_1852304 [Mycena leptocephala]|nr:hypothetical protein B0H13DRAFT_1852304 [Mycena leptocephala]